MKGATTSLTFEKLVHRWVDDNFCKRAPDNKYFSFGEAADNFLLLRSFKKMGSGRFFAATHLSKKLPHL